MPPDALQFNDTPWSPGLRALRLDVSCWVAHQVTLPEFTGSTLRGFLKLRMRERLCLTRAPHCTGCPLLDRCGYGTLWERPCAYPIRGANNPQAAILPCPLNTSQRVFSRGKTFTLSYTLLGVATDFVPDVIQGIRYALSHPIGSQGGLAHIQKVQVLDANPNPITLCERDGLLTNLNTLRPHILSLQAQQGPLETLMLETQSPLYLPASKTKTLLTHINPIHLTLLLARRFNLLTNHLEDHSPSSLWLAPYLRDAAQVQVLSTKTRTHQWTRYTTRINKLKQAPNRAPMRGITGHTILTHVTPSLRHLWQLAQTIHVGKHTTYGLGKLLLRPIAQDNSLIKF